MLGLFTSIAIDIVINDKKDTDPILYRRTSQLVNQISIPYIIIIERN